jgi:hypothetical protein
MVEVEAAAKAEIDRDKVEAAAKAAEAKVCHRRL